MVKVQKPMVFCDFCAARATLCGDRRGRGAKTHGFLRFLTCSRGDRRGQGAKTHGFFAISALLARPSAGIGMVEVQKPMVFCDFCGARATLCGDRRGRGAKTHGFFAISNLLARPSARDRCGRGAKTHGFLRFLTCSRDPLRGSAWSRCKNQWFFAISAVLAQPSAGIGVVEVQKLEVFATFVVRTGLRELSRGSRACSRNRRVAGSIPPWSAGGRRKMQLAF